MTLCNWEQFLQAGQREQDRDDLADGVLVARVGMAEDNDQNRLVSELCALMNRLKIEKRCEQTHAMLSVKVLSS